MRRNLRDWFSTRWWWFVAGVAVLAVTLSVTQFFTRPSLPDSPTGPGVRSCATSQLRLHLGSNYRVAQGRVQSAVLSVTNVATTCALPTSSPLVQPVWGARRRPVGLGDVPDVGTTVRVVLAHGHSAYATLSVVTLPAKFRSACRPRPVSGVVLKVGSPLGSTRYLSHGFAGVCSNRLRLDVGASVYSLVKPIGTAR